MWLLIGPFNDNNLFFSVDDACAHCSLYGNEDVIARDHLGLDVGLFQPVDCLYCVVLELVLKGDNTQQHCVDKEVLSICS